MHKNTSFDNGAQSDTIAAIATPLAPSAIGIVRVSGDGAICAADKIFKPKNGISLINAEAGKMYYGEIRGSNGELTDIGMCFISRAPNSFTGQDTAELHLHGSPIVLTEVLHSLYAQGVRAAKAGEFTKRAFLNGKLDLTRAEAIIDIIEAQTPLSAQNAAFQLGGAVEMRLNPIYNSLLDIMAHFHVVIDYPDEDIDDFKLKSHINTLQSAKTVLETMLSTQKRGKVFKDGIPAAIVGRPNTGKSSLLNAILGYDRAIVTSKPGTTRDTIEEKAVLGGVLLSLTDTAGLRETFEEAEQSGIERTKSTLNAAALAILVLDISAPLQEEDISAMRSIPKQLKTLIVLNKTDLPRVIDTRELKNAVNELGLDCEYVEISALTGQGIDILEEKISQIFKDFRSPPRGEIITNARQTEAISRARDSISRAVTALQEQITPDAVLTDVELALSAIGEITGKEMRETVVSRIFERFCVGK